MTLIQRIDTNACGCDEPAARGPLIGIDEALALIGAVRPIDGTADTVPLAQAAGRVLARPVQARGMVPPFDNAAMDGYAISTADLSGPGPWMLPLAGRIPAGQAANPALPTGQSVQVFTGAPVPSGADAVVMQEHVERDGGAIRLSTPVPAGTHIRRAGEDIVTGQTLLSAGRCLTPRDIAVCAAAGHDAVTVTRRPRVALVVTGDEVRQPGQPRGSAGIWDINTPMLSAALTTVGIAFQGTHIAADTRDGLRAQLDTLADTVDLIVTTGGISVGEEDHVKPALGDLGATIAFSGVAMKPGKPVSFGHLRGARWLGLPGNPLSALVTWHLFGTAACAALAGESQPQPRRRHVVLSTGLAHRPGRCELRLARLAGFDGTGREVVGFPAATHSGRVSPLPDMDGLLFIPANAADLPPGALVEFQPF